MIVELLVLTQPERREGEQALQPGDTSPRTLRAQWQGPARKRRWRVAIRLGLEQERQRGTEAEN